MKQLYATFEAYIDGELNPEERQVFEKQLLADPQLKKQFDEFAAMRKRYQDGFAGEAAEAKLKDSLENLGKEFFPPSQKQKPSRRIWLLAPVLAAACALALLLFYRPKDLFRQYYQPPLAAFTEKGSAAAGLYQQAEQAFNAGDFVRAGQFFDTILAENPGDLQASFYRGLCHLETGDPAAARGMLEPLAQGPSAFAEDARWFLALSYLREKDYGACLAELDQIPEGSRWSARVAELKDKISRQ
ncbi:MAG: tetratricopeptide repeat protein [Saprospiraceae bacterium]